MLSRDHELALYRKCLDIVERRIDQEKRVPLSFLSRQLNMGWKATKRFLRKKYPQLGRIVNDLNTFCGKRKKYRQLGRIVDDLNTFCGNRPEGTSTDLLLRYKQAAQDLRKKKKPVTNVALSKSLGVSGSSVSSYFRRHPEMVTELGVLDSSSPIARRMLQSAQGPV